jgi:3-hydroxybutyryl-CoA dehydrogenase
MNIESVFIVGAGLMGSGIAQACAQAGRRVWITDAARPALDKALKNIEWSAGKLVEKGKTEGSLDEIMGRIQTTMEYEPAAEADLCLEAVFENLELKKEIFARLDQTAWPGALIASNTSAISISTLAARTARPENVLGLHFFSPVPMMAAAEVVRGLLTSDRTFETGLDFVRSLGKEPVPVHRDVPGFVINRINFRAAMEAMRLVEDGTVGVEDVDRGLRLASGRKMGVFETGDLVGLDVTCGALTAIYEETKDPSWFPPAILRRKVQAGHLGRKTGRGWYEYHADGTRK